MGYTRDLRDLCTFRMDNRGSRYPKAKYLAFFGNVIQIRNAFSQHFIKRQMSQNINRRIGWS
ncbi:hypothetical protein M5D96_002053 [Drosophila gunungcola]|uniref:Uncharacterized protein n=1 Tax=Drosophila gunungcola TaxID=103775 RepID=A0A9P9YZB6_9MUSC|nr:hypothetical protein M5D96_002053 [Drosophila gunungcola]